jgi:hypothetical protein
MSPEQITTLMELADQLKSLFASSTIPRSVETAFVERLGVVQGIQDGGSPTTTAINAFPVNLPNATKILIVNYKGTIYNLLAQ